MDIGLWVQSNRVVRSWSQSDLATRLGTAETTVSRWERGVALPRLDQFRQLCLEFERSADEALGLRLTPAARKRRVGQRPEAANG